MFKAIYSLFTLRWRQQFQLRPLPAHVERFFVPSPDGELELLASSPTNPDPDVPPIFLIHGGYGSAGVWLEWMTYLHEAGYRGHIYSYSARSHGASYSVPYFRMVYNTPFGEIVSDCMRCLSFARKQQQSKGLNEDFVLVAHSSGGGVAQYALSKGLAQCRALCLCAAIPHFGALPVYANWARHDPWFMVRSLFHLQHPTSPLSSPRLVHGAFFGDKYPMYRTKDFMQWMPPYESMWWPMTMMGEYLAWWQGSSRWLNVNDILRNVSGNGKGLANDRICVMVGTQDVLMDLDMNRRQASEFRQALSQERNQHEGGKSDGCQWERTKTIEGVTVDSDQGVRLVVIDGAGHHLQNDIQQDESAEAFMQFVQQC